MNKAWYQSEKTVKMLVQPKLQDTKCLIILIQVRQISLVFGTVK